MLHSQRDNDPKDRTSANMSFDVLTSFTIFIGGGGGVGRLFKILVVSQKHTWSDSVDQTLKNPASNFIAEPTHTVHST